MLSFSMRLTEMARNLLGGEEGELDTLHLGGDGLCDIHGCAEAREGASRRVETVEDLHAEAIRKEDDL